MKWKWLEDKKPTCSELEAELGCKIKHITIGDIIVGYRDAVDPIGNPIQEAITRRGIEIEFEGDLDATTLLRLDRDLRPLRRTPHIKFTPENPIHGVEQRLAHVEQFLTHLYPPQP